MAQGTVNERLKILVDKLGMSVSGFSKAVGVPVTTTQNYIKRGTVPKTSYLLKIVNHFEIVNSKWLVLGEGEPFKEEVSTQNQTNISGKKSTVAVANGKNGTATTNNYTLSDCEKERDSLRAQLDKAQREIELLIGQLQMQKTIIEGKDQMLDLLKGGFNRPN